MKVLLQIAALVFLVGVTISDNRGYISKYLHRNFLLNKTKQELNAITNQFFQNRTVYVRNSSLVKPGYFYNTSLNISVDRQSTHFNDSNLVFTNTADGYFISGANSIRIDIGFKYNAKLSLSPSFSGQGNFSIVGSKFNVTKQIIKKKDNNNPNWLVDNAFDLRYSYSLDSKMTNLDKKRLEQYFSEIVEPFKNQLLAEINANLDNAFASYYIGKPEPTLEVIPLGYGNKSVTLDLLYNDDPIFRNDTNSCVFFHNAYVFDFESPLRNKRQNLKFLGFPEKPNWNKFLPADGNVQYFFDFDLFSNIISNVTASGLVATINQDNFNPELPFNLTIEYLSTVIPDILKNFSSADSIFINCNLTNSTLYNKRFETLGRFNLQVDVIHKNTNTLLLSWANTVNHNYLFKVTSSHINLDLGNIVANNYKLLNSTYGTPSESFLTGTVQNVVKELIGLNRFQIFAKGLIFDQEIVHPRQQIIPDEGVLIYGKNK